MTKIVADQFVETLAAAGVKRVYGIAGDTLDGLTEVIRRRGKIEWIRAARDCVSNPRVDPAENASSPFHTGITDNLQERLRDTVVRHTFRRCVTNPKNLRVKRRSIPCNAVPKPDAGSETGFCDWQITLKRRALTGSPRECLAVIIRACLLSLSSTLFITVAAAQTPSWPIVDGRHLQPTQQQVDRKQDDRARQRNVDLQSDVDRLYDEITRRACAATGASPSSMELEAGEAR
jgi:hypothetical protein